MKNVLASCLLVMTVSMGCGTLSAESNLKAFVPGAYTAEYDGEFSSTVDSVWIQAMPGDRKEFDVRRHRYHAYSGNSKQRGTKLQTDHWVGRLDAERRVIRIDQSGRLLYLLPEQRQIRIGSRLFEKINP